MLVTCLWASGEPCLSWPVSGRFRICFLHARIHDRNMREGVQAIRIEPELMAAARDNLVATQK